VRAAIVYAKRRTRRGQTDGHTQERQTDRQSRDRWTARGRDMQTQNRRTNEQRRDIRKQRVETDGPTNLTKLTDAFRDYVKVPKK
jgi:hypothetical protein